LTGGQDKLQADADTAAIQRQIRDKLATFEKSTLRIAAIAIGMLFTIRVVVSFVFLPFAEAMIVAGPLGASILLSLCILIAYHFGTLKIVTARAMTALLATLVTFNVFYILHMTDNVYQLFFATLLLAAFGLIAPTFAMWLVIVVPFIITYLVSLFIVDIANVAPYVAALIGGSALSVVAYFVRIPTIRKLTELEVIQSSIAEKLELSNKAKDQFLANMTHELRTPLTGVIGMIDLMADTELTDLQQYYLGTTRRSTRYLLTVINDILDMSKLEAGKLAIHNEAMDAIVLSGDIASLFEMRAKQKGLEFTLQLPAVQSLPVVGDATRISQVLLNLLENALKFTTKGGITLALEASDVAAGIKLTWSVRDTGIGIPKDRLPKLFDRFEQIDSSATRATPGTGLGLAIVNDLADLMNGHIGASSEVGVGSEFWFTLDVPTAKPSDVIEQSGLPQSDRFMAVQPSEYVSSEGMSAPPPATSGDLDSSLRILFAEDNHINRELIIRLIRREGWSGTAANNGQEAIDALKANPEGFDLILMDIQMPVLDGVAALKVIRAEIVSPPPIIALTANTLPEDTRQYREVGFDAVVGKPINVTILRAAVEKLTASNCEPL